MKHKPEGSITDLYNWRKNSVSIMKALDNIQLIDRMVKSTEGEIWIHSPVKTPIHRVQMADGVQTTMLRREEHRRQCFVEPTKAQNK